MTRDGDVKSYLFVIGRGVWPNVGGSYKDITWDGRQGSYRTLSPNVWQLELVSVPIKGWIIDPNVHGPLMVLVILHASLPTMEKWSRLIWWPEVWPHRWEGESWDVPWILPQKFLPIHLYTPCSLHGHTWTCRLPHFSECFSLSLGTTRVFLMVLPPLKCSWTQGLPYTFLLSVSPLVYGTPCGCSCFCCYCCCKSDVCCGCFGPDY